jgi:hypothetical protein
MVRRLLVIRTVAGSIGRAAGTAERKPYVEDRLPGDLGFAGNTGEGIFGAQAAHEDLVVEQLHARQTWPSEGRGCRR